MNALRIALIIAVGLALAAWTHGAPAPAGNSFLLLEDGSFLLLEDSSKLVLE